MTKKTNKSYEIAALAKGLIVLQALEGSAHTPLPMKRIVERISHIEGITPNYVFRALKTLEIAGLVRETELGYVTTTRLKNLAL